ncbi:hypothetical protein L1765_12900 [Microaerobacter geothermalis]|uniref:hypothetical protein n=1 Tax=Microaerobacter geothermalis TaxID=674972 RepID=UPI001F1DFA21|nr:hypothetical protein [Microaerobacter geothermalis]MCF6094858.1 hypothetical protein [Microaerobacter geothermalis]
MNEWRSGLILTIIALFFLDRFFNLPYGEKILAGLTLLVIIISIPISRGIPKIFGSLMLVIGTLILLGKDSGIDEWAQSMIRNLPLMALIVLVPILTIPIKLGGYDSNIESITNRYRSKPNLLFLSISIVFQMIGPVVNLGSIRLIDAMLKKLKLPAEFLGKVYIRGFTSIITWSPYFAAVLLILYYVDIPLVSYLPFGILLGLLQLIIGNLLFIKEAKKIEFPEITESHENNRWKIFELIVAFSILTSIVFFFEYWLQMDMIMIVALSVFIFPFFWSLYLKSFRRFIQSLNYYRKYIVPGTSNEVILFLTAGFFGAVLSNTSIGLLINDGLRYLAETSILLMIILTIILTSLLALFGVHQIVTLISVASSVIASDLGIEKVVFALLLMSAWSVSTIVSPITPVNVIVSSLINKKPLQVSLKWNGVHALLVISAHTLYIYLVHIWISGGK